MTVYADILIGVNIIINFLLLMLTAKICKSGYKLLRLTAAAFLGGLFSLYIFLPEQPIVLELVVRVAICLLITFTAFGFNNIKYFIKTTFYFLCFNMLFGGVVLAVWSLFKPNGIIVNNGMVYFDISPIMLISTTLVSYFAITIIQRFTKRNAKTENTYTVTLFYNGNRATLNCLKDTGNSLRDNISDRPVIIINKATSLKLLDEELTAETVPKSHIKGFRLIPYYSVGSRGLLPAFKTDYIVINNKKIHSVIAAVSNTEFKEYDGLLSESLLETN